LGNPEHRPTYTPITAAAGVERAIGMLAGRWKLRFSDLERAIPDISQKMLTQQLRQMEEEGIVLRIVHAQVPPKVEYRLTEWGQSLCPALDALLRWVERQG
jgi:DNA-binding HxlR family transcriptional regulator